MNNGIKNEIEIVKYLNGKRFKELNDNMKCFISFLFKEIIDDDILYATKINGKYKADIIISINDTQKYISIKVGSENSIHIEKLEYFINFLKSLNINDDIINYLKLYHYGDGTVDGTGTTRLNAEETKTCYYNEISKFNKYISYNNILSKILHRFLFDGVNSDLISVDAIYYGNIKYGIWASKNEILKYLLENKSYYMKTIHFSKLTYQNWCRNINRNRKSESHRDYLQIKWFSLASDLQKIRQ